MRFISFFDKKYPLLLAEDPAAAQVTSRTQQPEDLTSRKSRGKSMVAQKQPVTINATDGSQKPEKKRVKKKKKQDSTLASQANMEATTDNPIPKFVKQPSPKN